MNYLSRFIYGPDKANISKEILSNVHIPLVNDKYSVNYEKIIAHTKTGKFYFGIYKNQKVLIKIIDITKDELILEEFIFWNKMKNNEFFLKLIAVDIYSNYAYIIFEYEIEYSLKSLLSLEKEPKTLSIDNKIFIIKQLLSLLKYFNENKIIHGELRSGIIGLNKEFNIKLIDYGELVELNTPFDKEIQDEVNKYIPPQYIKDNITDETFDIYSFGKILNGLFNNEKKDNINNNEEINPITLNIIQRCVEENKDKRIKFNELNHNLELIINEYYINNQYSDCTSDDFNLDYIQEKNEINEYYQFGKKVEDKLSIIIPDLKGNLENKIKKLKADIINKNDKINTELDLIKEKIMSKTNKYINLSKNIIKNFYDKLFNSIIYMQSVKLSDSTNDVYDIALKTKGMLKDISVLSNLINTEEYNIFKMNIGKTRNEINELIKKNSTDEELDSVYKMYDNQYNNYQKYCDIIKEVKDSFKNLNDLLDKNIENNINKMNKILAIDFNLGIIKEDSEYFKSMNNNIYAKIKENSNYIYIYNYFTKSISSHKISDNIVFNSKCYSFFDKEENCVYISGGCPKNDIRNADNSFYKISINFVSKKNRENLNKNRQNYNIFDFGEYNFTIKKLNNLLNKRYSHCMVRSLKERSMFINIGGKNTKTAEVYNIEKEQSVNIQDLPALCPNPICYEINENIYLFGNSEFDLSFVYYLDDNFNWIKIDYKMDVGSLKKGMNIVNYKDNIYIFGGYDNYKEYSDIYKLNFNEDNLSIDFCQNIALSHNCYFNSNAIVVEKKDEDGKKYPITIIMDSMDNVEEIILDEEKN